MGFGEPMRARATNVKVSLILHCLAWRLLTLVFQADPSVKAAPLSFVSFFILLARPANSRIKSVKRFSRNPRFYYVLPIPPCNFKVLEGLFALAHGLWKCVAFTGLSLYSAASSRFK